MNAPVVTARGLQRFYEVKEGLLSESKTAWALSGIDFDLQAGKPFSIIGESGCGKSTLAQLITMIEEPTGGSFNIDGPEVHPDGWSALRQSVQIVFQDPYAKVLLSTTPRADPTAKRDRIKLEGELPSPLDNLPGCAFAPQCWLATDGCRATRWKEKTTRWTVFIHYKSKGASAPDWSPDCNCSCNEILAS